MNATNEPAWKNVNFAHLRKSTLRMFLIFLSLTAGLAMVIVLAGDFGDFEVKVLFTTLTISAASICSMSAIAFLQKGGDGTLGGLAISVMLLTAVLLIGALWAEVHNEILLKLMAILCTVSVAFTHTFLLTLVNLDPRHRWAKKVGIGLIWVLAGLITFAIMFEVSEKSFYRILIVVAIAVTLFTLMVPIMGRMRKGLLLDPNKADLPAEYCTRLILDRGPDGAYRDADGTRYVVRRAEDEESGIVSDGAPDSPYG